MKNFLLASLLIIVSLKAFSQSFEGTMIWKINMDITDPATKAQLEQSQKALQDPEKLKELEDQLKSPEFQAMLEKNPQMKAHLDKTLEMMKSGGAVSMIPTGMTVKIKGKNSLTKMEGGIMAMEILNLGDKSYVIDRNNKTYWMNDDSDSEEESDRLNYKVNKTSEKKKIMGYNCTKYEVTEKDEGMDMKYEIWTTTDIQGVDFKDLSTGMKNGKKADFYKEIEGVPVLTKIEVPQGIMTMEMKEIKKESFAASLFTLPADFKKAENGFGFGE